MSRVDRIRFFSPVLVLLIILVSALPVKGQSQDERVQTSDQLQQLMKLMERRGDLEQDTAEDAPEEEIREDLGDLGRQRILRRREKHKYYSASASLTFQTIDNVRLRPDNPQFVFSGSPDRNRDGSRIASLNGGYHFKTEDPVQARVQASYQAVEYRDLEALNYDYFTLSGTARRNVDLLNRHTTIGAGYRFQSLLYGAEASNTRRLESVYDQHVISADIRSLYPLSRYRILSGEISLQNEFTTNVDGGGEGGDGDPEKTRLSINSAYRYQYSQKISYNARYQFQRDWYRHQNRGGAAHDRQDYTHILSGGMNYKLSDQLNLGFNLSYNENHSNHSTDNFPFSNQEYDSLSASISLGTNTRF